MRDRPLYAELVSLAEATAVAYHLIFDRAHSKRRNDEVDEARAELALALGALSTILLREGGQLRPVSLPELEAVVSRGQKAISDLSVLYIRRCHLIRAIESMQAGRKPVQH